MENCNSCHFFDYDKIVNKENKEKEGYCTRCSKLVDIKSFCSNYIKLGSLKNAYVIEYINGSMYFFDFLKIIEAKSLDEALSKLDNDYNHFGDLRIKLSKERIIFVTHELTRVKNKRLNKKNEEEGWSLWNW